MDDSIVIDEFLNKPIVNEIINKFRTNEWAKLNEEERYKVYDSLNEQLCAFFNMKKINLELSKDGIKQKDINDDSSYHNITIKDLKLWINDVNYNQYLTLHEYIVKVREKFQHLVCYSGYGKNFDRKLKKRWLDNFKYFEYKNSFIDYKIEDDEYLFEYQPYKVDSLDYAERLVVEIVKKNYNKDNSYDEQYFMNHGEIMVSSVIKKAGTHLYEEILMSQKSLENLINNLKKRIKNVENSTDLSEIKNEDLFLFIYPDFSKDLSAKTLVKIYNEIIARISPCDLNVSCSYNKIIINNNQYKLDYFSKNHFNLILYECMREIEHQLRNDDSFRKSEVVLKEGLDSAINGYKNKWIKDVIRIVDTSIDWSKLEGVNYQPLYRLLNKENLSNNLKDSMNGRIPYKKWRR